MVKKKHTELEESQFIYYLFNSLNPWCVPRRQAPTKNTNWTSSVQELNKFYSWHFYLHVWNQGTLSAVDLTRHMNL